MRGVGMVKLLRLRFVKTAAELRKEDVMRALGFVLGFIFVSFSAAGLPANANAGWQLVYAVDKNGETLAGDKAALKDAVRAGYPVRVGWGVSWTLPNGDKGGVEHVADAKFLSIYKGEVFAQVDAIVGQRPNPRQAHIAFRSDSQWVGILDTTGNLHSMMIGSEPGDRNMNTYWYVNRPRKPDPNKAPEKLY